MKFSWQKFEDCHGFVDFFHRLRGRAFTVYYRYSNRIVTLVMAPV